MIMYLSFYPSHPGNCYFVTHDTTQMVDSLTNFETVKYFGNDNLEAMKYDALLGR